MLIGLGRRDEGSRVRWLASACMIFAVWWEIDLDVYRGVLDFEKYQMNRWSQLAEKYKLANFFLTNEIQ